MEAIEDTKEKYHFWKDSKIRELLVSGSHAGVDVL